MRKTLLILISATLLLVGQATAIDLNSSRALQYYGAATTDGNLDFQVSTDGTVDVYGNLDMNSNSISNVDAIQDSAPANMFRNGDFETDYTNHLHNGAYRTKDEQYTGNYSIVGGESGFGQWKGVWKVREHTTGRFVANEEYTLYMYAKSTHSSSVGYGFAGCGGYGGFDVPANSGWQLYRVTFSVPKKLWIS